jgi:hypothetical protein
MAYARKVPFPPPVTEPVVWVGDPWERQPWETSEEYGRFDLYLLLGPERTVAKLVPMADVGYDRLSNTSRLHRWKERAAAYDGWQRAYVRKALEEGELESRLRHVAIGESLLDVLQRRIAMLHPDDIEVRDLANLAKTFIGIVREARGMSAVPTAVDVSVKVAAMEMSPDEKRAAMEAVSAELARRAALPRADRDP